MYNWYRGQSARPSTDLRLAGGATRGRGAAPDEDPAGPRAGWRVRTNAGRRGQDQPGRGGRARTDTVSPQSADPPRQGHVGGREPTLRMRGQGQRDPVPLDQAVRLV